MALTFRTYIMILCLVALALLVPSFANAATPLSCGTPASGVINSPTQEDEYSFSATAGDVVRIAAGEATAAIEPTIHLYNSSSAEIANATGGVEAIIEMTLEEGGDYTLVVHDGGKDETGDYTVGWNKLNSPCGGAALTCGSPATGSFTIGAQEDYYTFSGTSGDRIRLAMADNSGGIEPVILLYNASDVQVASASGFTEALIETTLDESGQYTLAVYDSGHNETGNYSLSLHNVTSPCSSTAITCGSPDSGSLTNGTQEDYYTFSGTSGDKIRIAMADNSGGIEPVLLLYNASDVQVASASGSTDALIETTLDQSGQYTLVAYDSVHEETGNYTVTLHNVTSPCGSSGLTCGSPTSGSLTSTTQEDYYTFSGTAGDKIRIATADNSGGIEPVILLYNASDSQVASASGSTQAVIETTLDESSQYTLVVYDESHEELGNYSLSLGNITNACSSTALTCGSPTTGSLANTTQENFYTFSGTSGDRIRIALGDNSGAYEPAMLLYNASAVQVAAADGSTEAVVETTLDQSGQYTLIVYDYVHDDTGDYSLDLNNITSPCGSTAITCGEPITGWTANTAQENYYTFSASSGDVVRIAMAQNNGYNSPTMLLYNASDVQVDSATGSNQAVIEGTLDQSGQYTLVVYDSGHNTEGNYSLAWDDLVNSCNVEPIVCGQTQPGSLDSIVEHDFFTFVANASDAVSLTMTVNSGTADPQLELYDSTGTKLTGTYNSSGNQVTLTNTISGDGTYSVIATDYSFDETGGFSLKYQKNGDECPEVQVTYPNGGEIIYTGTEYTITWTTSSSSGLSSQDILLSTDGGATYPTYIVQSLAANATSYDWTPSSSTTQARIKVTALDTVGLTTEDYSDTDFAILNAVTQTTDTYGYDKLNRLIHVDNDDGTSIDYTYDGVGNRLERVFTDPGEDLSASPEVTDFGDVASSSYSDEIITITNDGASNVAIQNVTGLSSPYSVISDGCTSTTLSPTQSCQITARFSPSAAGQSTDTITITSDSGTTPTLEVPVRGYGVPYFDLSVIVNGTGNGDVTSYPAGISCSEGSTGDCTEPYLENTSVILNATADSGYIFTGWTNAPCGSTSSCTVEIVADTTVTGTFAIAYELTVDLEGTGFGNVTSAPAGIDCGNGDHTSSDCTEEYAEDDDVTLTAVPDSGSVFVGWWGGGCEGISNCIVSMDAATTVQAIFAPSYDLTVYLAGSGYGNVVSADSGGIDDYTVLMMHADGTDGATLFIDNSSSGYSIINAGDSQIDTAQYRFGGSSGLFDGSGDYLTIDDSDDWDFGTGNFTIDFWVRPNGTISSAGVISLDGSYTPAGGILFGYSSDDTYWTTYISSNGSTWDISAGQSAGIITKGEWQHLALVRNGTTFYTFKNGVQQATWTSSSAIYNPSAQLHIAKAQNVYPGHLDELRITKGAARWTSGYTYPGEAYSEELSGGIDCGNGLYNATDCTETYPAGTSVMLTATADSGSLFNSWTGACSGADECALIMNASVSATATFDPGYVLDVIVDGTGLGNVVSSSDSGGVDPYAVLMLHNDGINNSTTFLDDSDYEHDITRNGDAQIDTAVSQFGGASGLFDGSGDYLTVDDSDDWDFGTGNFTIDFWVRPNGTISSAGVISLDGSYTPAGGILFGYSSDDTYWTTYISSNGSTWDISAGQSAGIITKGEWQHLALVRNGTTFYTFKNGVQQATWTSSSAIYNPSAQLHIAKAQNVYPGHLDEMRISKGAARWTSNFTPPAAPYSGYAIECGDVPVEICEKTYEPDAEVTLTPDATEGSVFTGWSGGGCNETGLCNLSMTANTTVYASFANAVDLSVYLSGTGFGNVISDETPAGIDKYVGLMLHAEGPDGMRRLFDSSNSVHDVINMGETQLDTGQKKFGVSSAGFDGTGDYVSLDDSDDWYFNGDFTIDFWVMFDTLPATENYSILMAQKEDDNNRMVIYLDNRSPNYPGMRLSYAVGGSWSSVDQDANGAATWSEDTWYHVAIVKSDSDWYIFRNGTEIGNATSLGSYANYSGPLKIGGENTEGKYLDGWLDEVRISKGTNRGWTSNFSAPSAAYDRWGIEYGNGDYSSADSTEGYAYGTEVTLTAAPDAGSTFVGWTGDCEGTNPCALIMNSTVSVTAIFNTSGGMGPMMLPPSAGEEYDLNVYLRGTGLGNVVSSPPGINCGYGIYNASDCHEEYEGDTDVTLWATPEVGSEFGGWSGVGCGGLTSPCSFTIVTDSPVYADFTSGAPLADISVAIANIPSHLLMGSEVAYKVEVKNNGPETATGVMLTDTLPRYVTFVSAESTQGTCSELSGDVTCSIGSMADGAKVTVTIVALTPSPGMQINYATVSSATDDPESANDTMSVESYIDMVHNGHMSFMHNGTNIGLYRNSSGKWLIDTDYDGIPETTIVNGTAMDVPVPADYTGDGRTDLAFFRPAEGKWYMDSNLDGISEEVITFGSEGDVPLPANYTGILNGGNIEAAVFRPYEGKWYIDSDWDGVSDETISFGASGDIAVPGDYNGDGKTDPALFRPAEGKWFVDLDLDGNADIIVNHFGSVGDRPVVGDYDNDGATDVAYFDPDRGKWYIDTDLNGRADMRVSGFGAEGDYPVIDDHDNNGTADIGFFRPSDGTWEIDTDLDGVADIVVSGFGTIGDIPF